MAAWDEEALEQASKDFADQVRRLKGRNRRDALNKITQLLAELRMLAEAVVEARAVTPQPGEAAEAFREASRIATAPIKRLPSGTFPAPKTEPPKK